MNKQRILKAVLLIADIAFTIYTKRKDKEKDDRGKYAPERDIDTVQTSRRARPNKENMQPDYDTPAAMVIKE